MKTVIYYFSGTGNSMRAAMKIAESIGGGEIISVRCNPEEVAAVDADVIGFICPVYEWDIPVAMKEFVKKLVINSKAYIFMICTYIFIHGRAFETMEEVLERKNAKLSYSNALRCVASQCTAYNPFPPEKIMIPITEKNIMKISKDINARKIKKYPKMSMVTKKLYPKLMKPYIEVENEYDKGFYLSEECIGCGLCEKACSVDNITFEENHPVWNHKCNGCMACVVYCPKKAIKFQTPEAYIALDTILSKKLCLPDNRKRYHNPYIKAKDIIKDKQYIKPIENN